MTNFDNRVSILADLWLNFRKEEGLQDFIEYNDLALPFAFAISEGIFLHDEPGVNRFIDEAWEILLGVLGLKDDDYTSLEQMLDLSIEN